jgi:hypothetical protein
VAVFHACADAPGLSTLSPQFQENNRFTQRFGYAWAPPREVPVTCLDELIEQHGVPAFLKIDVEGLEVEVLKGLTQPVPCVSYEFNGEFWEAARDCAVMLEKLGLTEFNISISNSQLRYPTWVSGDVLLSLVERDKVEWGDIFARLPRR